MASDLRPLLHSLLPGAGTSLGTIHTLQQVTSRDDWKHLPGELPMAAAVASRALAETAEPPPTRLILVSSVPPHVPHMGAFTLAEAVGLAPGHVVDIGNHCAAMLDGLWLAMTLWKDEANLLVSATQLGEAVSETMRSTKPGSLQWGDGAAAVVLGGEGESRIRPLSYVTATDPSLHRMLDVRPQAEGYKYEFREDVAERFQAADLDNELMVMGEAIEAAGVPATELAAIVVVNRGRRRTELLGPAFGIDPKLVISSRTEIGHGGGADFLFNLDKLLTERGPGTHHVVVVGNGLGYCWSCLVVEIELA